MTIVKRQPRLLTLALCASMVLVPAVAVAQPGISAQAQSAALEKIIQGEDARNAEAIREAMQGGAQRRAGIRASRRPLMQNAPKLWPALPLRFTSIVPYGRPSSPQRYAISPASFVPTARC